MSGTKKVIASFIDELTPLMERSHETVGGLIVLNSEMKRFGNENFAHLEGEVMLKRISSHLKSDLKLIQSWTDQLSEPKFQLKVELKEPVEPQVLRSEAQSQHKRDVEYVTTPANLNQASDSLPVPAELPSRRKPRATPKASAVVASKLPSLP